MTRERTLWPGVRELPDRAFSDEFLRLRSAALDWVDPHYHREHLVRAGDWLLALDPDAPEPLVIAALTHDMERSVPGGPELDMARTPWDDPEYNRRHCERSARVVAEWLREQGAPDAFVEGIRRPILEHEFGGSPAGDLAQAADSLSFLESSTGLVVRWVQEGRCDVVKAREKLAFMYERIRLPLARDLAGPWYERALEDLDRGLAGDTSPPSPPNQSMLGAPLDGTGRSRTVEANGIRLHVLRHGEPDRPVILIVPGITSPAITWEFAAQALADELHVVTLDNRGRGLSDKPRAGYSLHSYADDVAGVIGALGLDRPIVLGHSMGARIAAAFATRHPRQCGPLILADPALTGPGRASYGIPLEAFVESLALARAGATADDMRPYLPTWTEEQLTLRAAWLATCDETAVRESYRMMHEEDFLGLWRRIEPPALFVWGEDSPATGAAAAAELAQLNPAVEIQMIPRAGHMIPWDNLGDFVEVVRSFCARVAVNDGGRNGEH